MTYVRPLYERQAPQAKPTITATPRIHPHVPGCWRA
jgi:hypothetical protein